MKNMDEFRRSVYEKAEKKAAEEKAKKLRITKFGTIAASLAVVIIPIMLVAGSMPKNNETEKPSPTYTEARTDGVETTAFSDEIATVDTPSGDVEGTTREEMYTTTPVYTTTPIFTTTTTPMFTRFETTRTETSRVTTTRAPFETETTTACTSSANQTTETTGNHATVTVNGENIVLTEKMSYSEICRVLHGTGEDISGENIMYRWNTDDATLTVTFELAGGSDEPYAERLKAVSFTISR